MARALADLSRRRPFCTEADLTIMTASVAIGAAGAVDSAIAGYRVPSDITAANTGTGTFSLVFPPCPNATIQVFIEMSAGATVTEAILTAKSASAGTASIRTSKGGTATNPASGDLIGLVINGIPTAITN